ncbi:Cyclic nucleotide-gated ion channel 1 [Morella rubra]|uniref:Cyclic nucleotide-gated ion channel 1 n=2 Tax=Morella rubra TaxID=262757 RepID=A0A6A1UXE6_9ROSI|nr:Cyclic nucleotide-gated ion channel 1 [Morella rubra]
MCYVISPYQAGRLIVGEIEVQVLRGCADQLSPENSVPRVTRPQGWWSNSVEILRPEGSFIKIWHGMLLASCVFAVFVDPFFFYLPVINEGNTCVVVDKKLKIVAISLRSFTDMIYLVNIALQFLCPYYKNKDSDTKPPRLVKDPQEIRKKYLSSYFAIDFLAILPIPQVLGAFWYFFSIERQTSCWYLACEKHDGCKLPSSFSCDDRGFGNDTFLNDDCPVQTPNNTLFDFGIFLEALQSDTVSSMDFLPKILFCFWWGLRNLSSYGSNLDSSPYIWENFFAIMISICGLFLFLYFIGNLQTTTSKQLQTVKDEKKKEKIKTKKESIELWIKRNGLECVLTREEDIMFRTLKEDIMFHIEQKLEEKDDVNVDNPFDLLPTYLKLKIKHHLCLPLLEKVPSQCLIKKLVYPCLEHVYYSKDNYIVRKGEPLDRMLLITEGVVWKLASNSEGTASSSEGTASSSWVCLEKGQFCGEELLEWEFKDSKVLISPMTLKTHTKVEGFVLMAKDLKDLLKGSSTFLESLYKS